ncbi:MAG: hypothetical protein KC422_19490 [Trueperaceae bacterium]|nr:hypothetical protein [Trueperaceae bacterium]
MIYLAMDVGTTGLKAALIRASGEVLGTASATYASRTYAGGIVEQDAEDWWQVTLSVIQNLAASDAEAIVLTGQMQNLLLLDNAGQPLRPVILYSDSRASAEAEAIKVEMGKDRLRGQTGNDQEAGSLLAKLRWLQIYEPETLSRSKHLLLGAADYLAYKFTGNFVTDTTTAATTGLMDLTKGAWAEDLLEELSLSETLSLLPELVEGGSEIGTLHLDMPGIRRGIPVYLAPGDAGTATLGMGSGIAGRPYAYMGTSGWVAYTSAFRGEAAQGVFTLAHPDAELFICVAPLLTAGGNLNWARSQLGFATYEEMINGALSRPKSSLLYLPYLNGERSPFSDPYARGAFIGLSSSHSKADMARAVLEGVAFAYKHALSALIQEPIDKLLFTGGGSRSSRFAQLLADVTGLEVSIPAQPEFTGLRGAVLSAQALKTGQGYALSPEIAQTLTPKKSDYEAKYELFLEAYKHLKNLFGKLRLLS